MVQSLCRIAARAFAASVVGFLLVSGGLSTTAFASGKGSPGGPDGSASHGSSQAGPPADASTARGQSSGPGAGPGAASNNRGHFQIEGAPDCGSTPCGNDNDPHVGCTFTVLFFGYPAGKNPAGLVIAGQAPSRTGTVLTDKFTIVGSSKGGNTLDQPERTYSPTADQLSAAGLKSQPRQGYHLRVDVSVNGEPAKSKVIWLDCLGSTISSPGSTPPPGSAGAPQTGSSGLTPAGPSVPSVPASAPASAEGGPDSRVLQVNAAAAADTPSVPVSLLRGRPASLDRTTAAKASGASFGFLAFTGWNLLLWLSVAAGAGGMGVAVLRLSKMRRPGIVS